MTAQEKVDRKLQEAYDHIKPYFNNDYLIDIHNLESLCTSCECWMGGYHDYDECRDKVCFRCWLAMVYLRWATSYE